MDHSCLLAESAQATLPGALVQLSAGPTAALAAGDSHEHTQDICGLTETSRARASHQMDGKDAWGWSSSWPGRAVTRTAGSVLGRLQARVGGEGASPALGLLLLFCTTWEHWAVHVPGLGRASPGEHRAGEAACCAFGGPVGLSASSHPIGN